MQNMVPYETLELSACCGDPIHDGGLCSGCGEHSSAGYLYTCEHEGDNCDAPATTEWVMIDEDEHMAGEGGFYYTNRCDAHPEADTDYQPRDIRTGKPVEDIR